ncbi:MFS transporter [Klenkia brasiliensis]|uniref:MFS transporter n=1 Tax=Klenkia brasiliensis TaxID=333142 RepID=UPI0013F6922E|nr:MFS transporter [Klenkia brasiliensis]
MAAGTALVACTYGLVRYAVGLSAPDAQRDLGLSTAAVGLVAGGTSVAYCLAAALAFLHAERRPRTVVAGAGAVAVLGAAGVGTAGSAAVFAAAAVLGSAGAGAASPGLVVLVRRAVAGPAEPRAQAVVNAGTGPGLVVAGLLAMLVERWQVAWTAAAAGTAVVTVVVLVAARGGGAAARAPRADAGRRWVLPVLAAGLLGAGSAAVWTHGRTVLQDGGLGERPALWVWVCLGVGATGAAVAGPLLLRAGPVPAWSASAALTAVAVLAWALPPRGAVPVLAALVFGLGFTTATTALIAWAGQVSRTPAAAVSVFFVALLLGQAAGAPATAALLDAGTPVALGAAAAATAAAAVLPLSGRRRAPRAR